MRLRHKIKAWLKKAFANFERFTEKYVEPAIRIVNVIKGAVDNPNLDIAVALTQTKVDDNILAWLRKAIDILEVPLNCNGSDLDKIKCFIEWLRSLPKAQRNAIYLKTASLIAQQADTISENEVDLLVQLEYSESRIA